MSRVTPFPDSLTRELCRLVAVEREALRSGDVPTFVHSRLRWAELIITLCPGLAGAAPQLGRRLAPFLPEPPKPVPRWKLELMARPLVRIMRRKIISTTLPSDAESHTAVEQLACGHLHRLLVVIDADLKATRRRCAQCGEARLAALAIRARTEFDVFVMPGAVVPGNSVRKGGRGESPEQANGAAVLRSHSLSLAPRSAPRGNNGNR